MNVQRSFIAIFLLFLIILQETISVYGDEDFNTRPLPKIQYTSAILRELKPQPCKTNKSILQTIPAEIKKRRRGKKGGVRHRYRRNVDRPPLPAIITGNARSLNNKLDELCLNTRHLNEYREAALICFSETWFHNGVTDVAASIDNFSIYRSDRTEDSGKQRGGGVCAYVNKSWANPNNVFITGTSCSADLEILSLKIRPYYLPREFTNVYLNVVYVPPNSDINIASIDIAEVLMNK